LLLELLRLLLDRAKVLYWAGALVVLLLQVFLQLDVIA